MIHGPYINCPKCGKESFGILGIYKSSYARRCKSCLHPPGQDRSAVFHLPKLNKKVVYLDQFAISDMMKARNPSTNAYKAERVLKQWKQLFERLDCLVKLNLVVCPESLFHFTESITSEFAEDLERMRRQLSNDSKFHEPNSIRSMQLFDHVTSWIDDDDAFSEILTPSNAIKGDVNGWQNPFIVMSRMQIDSEPFRESRNQAHSELVERFRQCQEDEVETFKSFLDIEFTAYESFLRDTLEACATEEHMPYRMTFQIQSILNACSQSGVPDEELMDKAREYLESGAIRNLPFKFIEAHLYAALRRKAKSGQKRAPNRGTQTDFTMIATLLPYCDAMLIDKECHGLLRDEPLKSRIGFETKLFSMTNLDEFFDFLDEIKASASAEHIETVEQVYGYEWNRPYLTLFDD